MNLLDHLLLLAKTERLTENQKAVMVKILQKPSVDEAVACLFHEEKTPSCVLNFKKNMFNCLSCGATDNIFPEDRNEDCHEKSVAKAAKILPAWFIPRMMCDVWCFGLLIDNGIIICISGINDVSPDGKWIDVTLLAPMELQNGTTDKHIFAINDDRTTASIQVSKIIMAYELAST